MVLQKRVSWCGERSHERALIPARNPNECGTWNELKSGSSVGAQEAYRFHEDLHEEHHLRETWNARNFRTNRELDTVEMTDTLSILEFEGFDVGKESAGKRRNKKL